MKRGVVFIDGWLTYAQDLEYGPTLVFWGEKKKPERIPKTDMDHLEPRQGWRVFDLIPGGPTAYLVRMSIEILDSIDLKEVNEDGRRRSD